MRISGGRERARAAAGLAALAMLAAPAAAEPVAYRVEGDTIPASLTGGPGDPVRGREIVIDRRTGLCLLCHTGPFPEERFQGTLAPDLAGAGTRWSEGQLRLRLVDPGQLGPATVMPSYFRVEGLSRVGAPWRGRPLLSAEEIEDVVAFLVTLRTP